MLWVALIVVALLVGAGGCYVYHDEVDTFVHKVRDWVRAKT